MSDKNMKNIVVLKNLPSNLVDEAIVILKSKNTAKKLELIEKSKVKNDDISSYFVRKDKVDNTTSDTTGKDITKEVEEDIGKVEMHSIDELAPISIPLTIPYLEIYRTNELEYVPYKSPYNVGIQSTDTSEASMDTSTTESTDDSSSTDSEDSSSSDSTSEDGNSENSSNN